MNNGVMRRIALYLIGVWGLLCIFVRTILKQV